MPSPAPPDAVADAQPGNWVDRYLPNPLRPYARLARLDRPIGFWLLFWPCAFALGLAAVAEPARGFDWIALILMWVGAVAMRGAGCTINDIVDAGLDAKVARTRSRPIPAGDVSRRQAAVFLGLQLLVGLVILLQFNTLTIWLGVASLVLVATYPFMKRITWWPQFFLGLAFSWGALVGWTSQTGSLDVPAVLLYVGSILWVIGYDTIYALQDAEDDALVGIKSTARLFGSRVKPLVGLFYIGALVLWLGAMAVAGAGLIGWVLMAMPAAILAWQVITLDPASTTGALVRFKANHWAGVAFTVALLAEYLL